MNIDRFAHPNLKIPSAIGCALGMAVGLGMWAGSGDFDKLKYVAAAAVVAVFILFFLRFTWVVGILICFLGFMQIGFGFTMGELEISLALAALVFAVTWWRKERSDRPPVFEQWSFALFTTFMILWLAYVAGHTVFNILAPYRPQELALKNMLKTVEAWVGPFLLMAYFGRRPGPLIVKHDFAKTIAWCMLVGLVLNIAIRIYQFATGQIRADDPTDPSLGGDFLVIPGLDLVPGTFILRSLPPTSILFCGAMIATQWFKKQTHGTKRLFYLVLFLSVIGATISGGRATLAFVLVLFLVLLVVMRQIGLLLLSLGACACLVAGVNMVPSLVKKSPTWVRRSLNVVLIEKDEEVAGDIESSSDWRYALFTRALDEWRSDPRIFWFGRATYSYGLEDYIAASIQGEQEATIESSLRRGATHNMVTDLLVIFGLIGLVLYTCLYFSLLFFLWKLYRSSEIDEMARALALVLFVSLGFNFVYGVVGGANFPVTMAWLYVILMAYVKRQHALREQTVHPTIDPPRKAVAGQAPAYARPALRPSM